jgi:DNA-binding transcriptional MerR regulator
MPTTVTIGDFSRMTHLSVKTLRHYHQVGLLEPVEINRDTGYRYYDVAQLPTAQVIRRFRDLGMPVEEVKSVVDATDVDERNALIAGHLDRLETRLDQTQAAVLSLRTLLIPVATPIEITHRSLPETQVLAISATIDLDDLALWWDAALGELDVAVSRLGAHATGWRAGLYDNALFQVERGTVAVFIPVAGLHPALGRVRPVLLPPVELAVAVHLGPHADIDRTYGALGTYVTEHALGVDGPVRETYLVSEFDRAAPEQWRTEIGWPIFQTTVR